MEAAVVAAATAATGRGLLSSHQRGVTIPFVVFGKKAVNRAPAGVATGRWCRRGGGAGGRVEDAAKSTKKSSHVSLTPPPIIATMSSNAGRRNTSSSSTAFLLPSAQPSPSSFSSSSPLSPPNPPPPLASSPSPSPSQQTGRHGLRLLLPQGHPEQQRRHQRLRLLLESHLTSQRRLFGGVVNHNISHSQRIPPASEKTGYQNAFDQADHPSLWVEDEQRAHSHRKDAASPAALVEPSIHPHQYEGMLARQRYWHYNQTVEPTFPRTPDLAKGELAAGATVTRTSVWHNPKEPAVVSIGRFAPDNFRPVGYAENAPCPESVNSDSHPDFREYRLQRSHADRRPFMYFLSASYFFIGASMMRSIVCKIAHFWWVSRDLLAAGTTEVDLSSVKVGETAVVKWRGKPVFVRHRPEGEIEQAKKDDALVGVMKDPEFDADRCPRPEWLINIGVCTHLGCIPTAGGSFGGWFCPCHGSHYDTSGRIRMGPAPSNLEIPPHEFLTDTNVRLG